MAVFVVNGGGQTAERKSEVSQLVPETIVNPSMSHSRATSTLQQRGSVLADGGADSRDPKLSTGSENAQTQLRWSDGAKTFS